MWTDHPLVVIDTETDSADPLDARLVQVCVGVSLGPGNWQPKTWLLKPARPIPPEATAVHGITTEYATQHGEDRDEALAAIWSDLAKWRMPWVLHNAVYDLTVLCAEAHRHGLPPERLSYSAVLDTLVLHRRFDRDTGSRTLTALAAKHGITFPAHDAEADSLATLRLLHILTDRVELLGHVPPIVLHQLQRGWYAAQQHQIVTRAAGEGRTVPLDTVWPIRTAA